MLSRFSYPNRPSLGPIIDIASFFTMWSKDRTWSKAIIFNITLIFMVLYTFTITANLIMNFNFDLFLNFVQYSSFYLSVHKMCMFALYGQIWVEVVNMISNIENESTFEKNTEHGQIVFRYKKYIQIFTMVYFVPLYGILFVFMGFFWAFNVLKPILMTSNKPLASLFYAWLPFDQNELYGRIISAVIQTTFAISTSNCAITWDTLMLSCMIFFAGQLKALRARCVQALDSPDEEQCWKNIIKCHQHHLAIIRYFFKFLYDLKI